MRGKQLVFVFAALCATVFTGCSDNAATTPNSGTALDPTSDASAATPITDAAVGCMNDASLTTGEVVDAPIGDSGATSALCTQCVRTSCASQLGVCQDSCECRETITKLLASILRKDSLQVSTQIIIQSLAKDKAIPVAICIQTECRAQCGDGSTGGGDAGPRDASSGD
jgi:hypothetical protein